MSIKPLIELCEGYRAPVASRGWLTIPAFRMNLYARRTQRMIAGEITDTIDIASVKIGKRYRGDGLFKVFMRDVEAYADEHALAVFVECVQNTRLADHLRRRGYTHNGELSWYRQPQRSTEDERTMVDARRD